MRKPWQEMEGLTTPEACEHLAALGMTVPADQAIVEVGVFKGRSAAALATYAGAPVYAIDPWDLPRPSKPKYSSTETYETAKANLDGYENVVLCKSFSSEAAKRWWGQERKVGLWYLDADHREIPVLNDFADWAPHFAPNAIVCFDDACSDFPGVPRAIKKLEKLGRITGVRMLTDRLCIARFHA